MEDTQATPAPADAHAADVLARIGEFVDRRTPWHRALWLANSVLSLHELAEYGEQLQARAITAEQVKDAALATKESIRRDAGIGGQTISTALDAILSLPTELGKEPQRNQLAHLTARAEARYLQAWEAELAKPAADRPRPERVARHLTAHLLDAGLSPEKVQRLLDEAEATPAPLTALCAEAAALLALPPTKHAVVVPLPRLPELFARLRDGDSRQLSVLHTSQALHSAYNRDWEPKFQAGVAITVRQRDPWAAVAAARELLARLQARLSVSRLPAALDLPDWVAVQGHQELYSLHAAQREVRVPALDRSRKTLQVGGYADADALDDALELLATLGSGTPGAALTNGWAALEGLLVAVGEKGLIAAERLADIVTADWPRSELTWLANAPFVPDGTDPSLHNVLRAHGKNSVDRKVTALEQALREKQAVEYERPRDIAALHRLENLVTEPAAALGQVRAGILSALRRLYVQRNLVMHAGSFRSVARATALRTVPAIAAAGMDRLVHAAADGVTPLMLAARAQVELDLLPSGGTGRPLCRLLD
jgi:hypothetical protein